MNTENAKALFIGWTIGTIAMNVIMYAITSDAIKTVTNGLITEIIGIMAVFFFLNFKSEPEGYTK
jgi:membrane associated rhomboid family serine protease